MTKMRLIGWMMVLVSAVAAGQSGPATRPLAAPRELPGVENFAQVSPGLFRGAQPTAEGFAELKKMGIKTVIDLRWMHDDRQLLKGTQLGYVRIPSQAWHPEDEDLIKFLKVALDPQNQPVFVHCAQGADRTGCAVAVYRILEQGWPTADAEAEMHNFKFHPVWKEIMEYLNHFDADAMRIRVEKAPPVAVDVVE